MREDSLTNYAFQSGGTLPANHPSYVEREADLELFEKLKNGDFCYVLNSRQMGKSSLWVQTLQKLNKVNIASVAIDLTAIGRASIEEWYEGLAYLLADNLSSYWDLDWEDWWEEKDFLSPPQRFSQFLEKVVINSVPNDYKKVVIFIDEIDFVKTLPFKSDDFFALIRACYNARANQPKYNRLTFCLLGVATPADLINDKVITPFNIGVAIQLQGFRLDEVESLIKGLEGKVIYPESVMSDILYWTGGQPFLTQRLCSLVVKEKNPTPDVSQIVQRMIIDNWEAQDEQEHLRTIKNRILNNEQRAGYLLELYRKILTNEQVTINNSSEETELQLSGLVVKKGNVLEVYNPIYAKVFNESWLDASLAKLRPYSENYRAWLQSGKTDESRLLRGQALVEAEKWAYGKNVGGEDRDFLGASRAKERAIEIERKEKESVEERNKMLEAANEEANQKIKRGTVIGAGIFGIMLIVASGLGWFAWQAKLEREQIKANITVADDLSQQAGILQQKNYTEPSKDALAQAGLSLTLKDPELKQALSWSGIALTHQYLGQRSLETEDNKPIKEIKYNEKQLEHWQKAQDAIIKSLKLLKKEDLTSSDVVPVAFFTYSVLGNLLEEHEFASSQLQQELLTTIRFPSTSPKTALDAYKKALKIPEESSPPVAESPELESLDNVRNVYRELSESLGSDSDTDETRKQRDNLRNLMLASLKKHYLYLTHARILALEMALKELDWKKADLLTWNVIYYSAQSKNIERFWTWRNTSCNDFRKIETLWYNQSNGKFSFNEQWKIYSRLNNNSPYLDSKAYSAFIREVGWYTEGKGWKDYDDLNWSKNSPKASPKGHLPVRGVLGYSVESWVVLSGGGSWWRGRGATGNYFFSLTIACEL